MTTPNDEAALKNWKAHKAINTLLKDWIMGEAVVDNAWFTCAAIKDSQHRAQVQRLEADRDALAARVKELEAEAKSIMDYWRIESDASLTECVERNISGFKQRCLRAEARVGALEGALRMIVDEKCDYMKINNLGNAELTHTVKVARAALSADKKEGG